MIQAGVARRIGKVGSTDIHKSAYLGTLLTSVFLLFSGVLVFRLASHILIEADFLAFTISRRAFSLLVPGLIMGFGVSLPKYVARITDPKIHQEPYYFGAFIPVFILGLLCLLVAVLAPHPIAYFLFGSLDHSALVVPIGLTSLGLVVRGINFAYFRGTFQIRYANLLDVISVGIIPLLAFLVASSVAQVLWFIGICTLLVGLSITALIFRSAKGDRLWVRAVSAQMFSFGLKRVPGDLALAALLGLPAIIAVHMAGLREGGIVALGCSLLTVGVTPLVPIATLLLPQASRLFELGEIQKLKRQTELILYASLAFALVVTACAWIFMDFAVRLYLGEPYAFAAPILRLMFLGVIPYSAFVCLRSLLDAGAHKALNARNCYAALALFSTITGAGYVAKLGTGSLIVAFLLGLSLLGILSYLSARALFAADTFAPTGTAT